MEKIRLIELIDQTPAIKSKFKTENITMFSGYDIHTHISEHLVVWTLK